jgi:phosphoglycerate dehydrogenase-like enzyme
MIKKLFLRFKGKLYYLFSLSKLMKCVLYFPGIKEAQTIAEKLPSDFKNLQFTVSKNRKQLLKEVENAEVLFTGMADDEVINRAKKLKWFHCAAAGVDYLIETMRKHQKVLFTSSKGVCEEQISEWVLAMALYFLKNIKQFQYSYDNKKLDKQMMGLVQEELFGKTICVVGLGRIGKKTAQKFKAFSCKVLGIKREKEELPYVDRVGTLKDMNAFFSQSDIITVHLALTEETKGCIDREAIYSIKQGALFINTARGALINEEVLIKRLRKGEINAVLDVARDEPIKERSPLLATSNLLLTPHLAGFSNRYFERLFALFSMNLRAYLKGKKDEMVNLTDLGIGY